MSKAWGIKKRGWNFHSLETKRRCPGEMRFSVLKKECYVAAANSTGAWRRGIRELGSRIWRGGSAWLVLGHQEIIG